MSSWSRPLADGRVAHVRVTSRADGDLAVRGEPAALAARRGALRPGPWVWLEQVHGAQVVVVGPDDDPATAAGLPADAVVTARDDVTLAVHSADCATVGLVADEGVVGAAHAGWRGLVAGVLPATAEAMRALGATRLRAWLGPCIGPECYEFGADDLERVVAAVGPGVRGRTRQGTPALDLAAGVRLALEAAGVELQGATGGCTACDAERWFSHRARAEQGRHALLAWIGASPR